jgi:DNA repair exonuclease SbcCD ATPase subunit
MFASELFHMFANCVGQLSSSQELERIVGDVSPHGQRGTTMLVKNPRGTLKNVKQFQADQLRRNIMQLGSLITELERADAELGYEVERLEQSTGKADSAHVAYSLLAKALIKRRANIQRSVIEFAKQLDESKQALAEALRKLEEIEMAEQKHLQLSHSAFAEMS